MNTNEPTLPEESLFLKALEIDSPDERVAFLDRACGADAVLRNELEALLRHHREGPSFLESSPTEVVVAAEQLTASEAEGPALDFLSPSNDAQSLGRLGYYEILEVLGHGGFGVVFKARDTKLDRIVAVKTLSQSLATSATARKRFVREAKAAAAVKHENVVGIYHVSDEGPVPYLVMECVNGVSLETKLQQVGTLDLPAILRIGMQVASGLAAAHQQGLVHRDVKPGNILLENGVERVKITDFGLARAADDAAITKTGEIAGTPQYMSPEQAQGLPLDARSDLFSLGSVLYAMCTGRSPFRAESTIAALRRVCDDTPRPIPEINADIPDWLADIISRLLAKQSSERYQTATEVAELLGRHLALVQQSGIVPNPKPTIVPRKHPSAIGSRWWSVALIAPVAVACIMGLTEASGVTKVVPTVIRIVRGEGTLVIEVDDPTVQVSLDGEALSIRGAGLQELRLLPGKYRLHATKDGQPVKDEVVTISRDGRKVVTVTRESSSGSDLRSATPALKQPAGDLKLLAKLDGHTDIVRGVAFLADGKRIVSVGRDRKVQIWELKTHHLLSTLPVKGYPRDATVSLDGRLVAVVATVGEKIMAQIWDLEKRELLWELPQDFSYVTSIRLSPDGTRMVTVGKPRGGILWDLTTGKELKRLDIGVTPVSQAATFSPDGRLIALGAVGRVRLFDAESGDILSDINLPDDRYVNDLAFMATGKILACGQVSGNVHLIDVDARQVKKSLKASHAPVVRLRFLGNDRFLLTTCFDATLRLLDIERGVVVATTATEKGTNERMAVSLDGRYAVTASGEDWDSKTNASERNGDYAVRVWQLPESVWPTAATKIDHGSLATEHVAHGRLDEAAKEFSVALDLTEGSNAKSAERQRIVGEIVASDELFKRVVEHRPKVISLWGDRAYHLAQAGRWEESVACYQKRLDLAPDGAGLWQFYSLALIAQKDEAAYRSLCEKMLVAFADSTEPSEAAHAALAMAIVPDSITDKQQAFRLAERGVKGLPEVWWVRLTYLAWLYRLDRLEEAVASYDQERDRNPETFDLCFLAMAHHRLGHAEEARKFADEVRRTQSLWSDTTPWYFRVRVGRLVVEMDAVLAGKPDMLQTPKTDDAKSPDSRNDQGKATPAKDDESDGTPGIEE